MALEIKCDVLAFWVGSKSTDFDDWGCFFDQQFILQIDQQWHIHSYSHAHPLNTKIARNRVGLNIWIKRWRSISY
jgi:hypothetical protein